MLQAEPQKTQFDLHFDLFGFPVRIHPLFWLMAVIFGFPRGPAIEGQNRGVQLLIFVAVIFVSILIHELGHCLMMRRYGERARMVLYMLGGLAIRDSGNSWGDSYGDYGGFGGKSRGPWQQIAISFAGPLAGFILAACTLPVVYLLGGEVHLLGRWPFLFVGGIENFNVFLLLANLLFINIVWGLVNLLPVFPLDGGQIAQAIFTMRDPWEGIRKSLYLSLFTALAMAGFGVLLMVQSRDTGGGLWIVLLFASLAYSSYNALQQMGGGGNRPW